MMNCKSILTTIAIVFSTLTSFSQEICDNGIDDDGNGLIDLNDNACNCTWIKSYIPNHSFEDTICCPNNSGQINCAFKWKNPSDATPDYFNKNCSNYQGYFHPQFINSNPIPDGFGYAGIYDGHWTCHFPNKEYIAICLDDTLYSGIEYQLKFKIAFLYGSKSNPIGLYGTDDCSNTYFSGYGCPITDTNWYGLDSVWMQLDTGVWNEINITFVPKKNTISIALGPNCKMTGTKSFFLIDQLILNKKSEFKTSPFISTKGVLCENTLVLHSLSDYSPKEYQWYKEGIAINGANSKTYKVKEGKTGTYQLKLTYDSSCYITSLKVDNFGNFELEMPNVFSPNNDEKNDLFYPLNYKCVSELNFKIYNRWGVLVHKSSSNNIVWDGSSKGRDCNEGTYFWVIDLNGKEGKKTYKGTVTLYR